MCKGGTPGCVCTSVSLHGCARMLHTRVRAHGHENDVDLHSHVFTRVLQRALHMRVHVLVCKHGGAPVCMHVGVQGG